MNGPVLSESVSSELRDNSPVPRHVAPHHQVLTHREPGVDEGLAVLVVSVVEVGGQEHTAPTDRDDVPLELLIPDVLDVVGDQGHADQGGEDEDGEGGCVEDEDVRRRN